MEEVAHRFPEGFLWGAATAAHQVEGHNRNNDWWDWEQLPGRVRDGSVSGAACEHYERFAADFAQLAGMGHNAHRLSVEWSRIEPEPGRIERAALAHYRAVLESLRDQGMEPILTLHHFTNPRWLAARGGWADNSAADHFRAFAKLCASEFGDLVRLWVTINEPNVYAYQSYVLGEWPPQVRDLGASARVLRNMLRGHARAYHEIKAALGERASVGVAQHLRVFEPARRWMVLDRAVAALPDAGFNHWFLRGCRSGFAGFPLGWRERVPEAVGTLDFVGVNYYSRDMVAFDPRRRATLFTRTFPRPGASLSEFQMEVYPEGLHRVLKEVHRRYGLPVYITENGVADRSDRLRPAALIAHIAETGRAIRDGVDVRGYLHWSSMDNFEWAEGYAMKFGLIDVDFSSQARVPRASAGLYSSVIRRGGPSWHEIDEHYPAAAGYFR